jgi:hypothetical protein
MTENKPSQYIRIGKLLNIYSTLITFCAWAKLRSEPSICPCISPISSPIARQDKEILRRDTSSWVYLGVDSSRVTLYCYIKSLSETLPHDIWIPLYHSPYFILPIYCPRYPSLINHHSHRNLLWFPWVWDLWSLGFSNSGGVHWRYPRKFLWRYRLLWLSTQTVWYLWKKSKRLHWSLLPGRRKDQTLHSS